jgi:drug/metabolite transporter (DMT)-like permease
LAKSGKVMVRREGSPYALALVTISLWSFGTYLGRLISMQSAYVLLLLTFVFATITLVGYFRYQARRTGKKIEFSFHWAYILWGPLGYFAYNVPQNQSFRAFGSASETTILNYTWPIFAMLFSKLFTRSHAQEGNHRLANLLEGLALFLGLFSVVLVATEGSLTRIQINNPPGLIWGIITGLSYGLFSAYSTTVPRERQPVFLLTGTITSTIFISPFALSELHQSGLLTFGNIGLSAIMGCLLSGVAYITWTAALRRSVEQSLNLARVLSLVYVLPLLSLTVIFLLLGEGNITRPYFLVSVVLIIISSILSQRSTDIAGRISARKRASTSGGV